MNRSRSGIAGDLPVGKLDDAFDLYLEDIESVEAELLPSSVSAKFSTASTVGCAACVGGSTAGTFGTVGCIFGGS